MSGRIKLIAGLGNPGDRYVKVRHNVGAWFVENLACQQNKPLIKEKKFHGLIAKCENYCIFKPTTFMNESGQAIAALAHFYKIKPLEVLIVHDELGFYAGTIRLKKGGGPGGHNGLRNIIQHLRSNDFYRLRIGIDHPGHKDHVIPYVLSPPSENDRFAILTAIKNGLRLLSELVQGDFQKVMQELNTRRQTLFP